MLAQIVLDLVNTARRKPLYPRRGHYVINNKMDAHVDSSIEPLDLQQISEDIQNLKQENE